MDKHEPEYACVVASQIRNREKRSPVAMLRQVLLKEEIIFDKQFEIRFEKETDKISHLEHFPLGDRNIKEIEINA